MKLIIKRQALLERLEQVNLAAAPRRATLPVLKAVLFKATKAIKELELRATDLEVELEGSLEAEVQQGGSLAVEVRDLRNFLREVKTEETLSLEAKDKRLIARAGTQSLVLEGFSGQDFPTSPHVPFEAKGKVSCPALGQALKKISFCASSEDSRPGLTGVCFSMEKRQLVLVAADGFRLGVTRLECQAKMPQPAIVPRRAVEILERLDPVSFAFNLEPLRVDQPEKLGITRLHFQLASGLILETMTIQSNFPAYRQLFPKGKLSQLVVELEPLKKALQGLQGFVTASPAIRFVSQGKSLVLSRGDEEKRRSITVPAHGRIKSAFDVNLILPIVAQAPQAKMLLMWGTTYTGRVRPTVFDYGETLYLLQPMFVHWE